MVKQREKKRPHLLNKPLENTSVTEHQKNAHDLDVQSGIVIMPKRGKTENVVIARGKLNRIVTPYSDPKVLTVDAVETKIDGSAVYIATDSESPVSLFISDAETGNTASLQLTPKALLTPVEIMIEGDQSKFLPGGDSDFDHAKMFRKDMPYISELKSILQSLGKQQIPQGFTLEDTTEKISSLNLCHDPNLTFWPGQIISGHGSEIIVMVAQNSGATATVFEETSCATENTIAVAAWPKLRLEPKDRTEVYILVRLPAGKSGEEARPSLLN
jgi:conjugal transfer pilus assembly protein TraK